jgi:nucleotide-binding universal stress UspA family protein
MHTILVQMANEAWTEQALHFACALARNNGARIILLRLMQVQHLGYLGTEFGSTPLSSHEYAVSLGYAATAEAYGVELIRHSMQCWSELDALADAADYVDAQVIFAYIPHSRIPCVDRLRRWGLQRRLGKAKRQLYTLEPSAENPSILSIVVNPVPASTAHK